MKKFTTVFVFALILFATLPAAYAGEFCFNRGFVDGRTHYSQEHVDKMIQRYPELDLRDLDYDIVSTNQMELGQAAGETIVETRKMQKKKIWSTGLEEIIAEWEEVSVPGIKFDKEKTMTESSIDYVWIHEHAHVIYYRSLTKEQREEWEGLYISDRSTVSDYGAGSPEENFAEWFVFYFYPEVFAKRECFKEANLDMDRPKNIFFSNLRKIESSRLGWLTAANVFVNTTNRNAGKPKADTKEQLARNDYRRKNGYRVAADEPVIDNSAPKDDKPSLTIDPNLNSNRLEDVKQRLIRRTPTVKRKRPGVSRQTVSRDQKKEQLRAYIGRMTPEQREVFKQKIKAYLAARRAKNS